jgi:phosphatidylserine/phosphatidylglycerophosphate/cardiolipin synthase-like enzyme
MSQNKNETPQRSNTALSIGAVILVVLLAVVSQITGIDFLAMLSEEEAPEPTAVVVQRPAEEVDLASPFLVYFTAPTGSRDATTYVNGLDTIVADAIRQATQTIDIAAFELNAQPIADALLDRHQNGVQVRVVTDDDHGLDISLYEEYLAAEDEDEQLDILDEMEEEPEDTLLDELYDAGIPIVDDDRSALMHNKFIIIDGAEVWMGSMNLTVNGSYRNNNNFVRVRSRRIVENYQAEFNEMFEDGEFGPRSPSNTPNPQVTVNEVPVEVYFAPEDMVIDQVIAEVNAAQSSIKFMAFSFTENLLGEAVLNRAADGIFIQGVFENVGSRTEWSELSKFYCADLDVRQDGNPFILHHKVMIIDDETVIIGSFNFSGSATESNDENLLIVHDASIAAQYLAEYEARFAEGEPPEEGEITCPVS